jgi:hypothetical protein
MDGEQMTVRDYVNKIYNVAMMSYVKLLFPPCYSIIKSCHWE